MKNANDFVKQKSNYSTSASSDLPFVFDGEVVVSEPLQTVETTIEDVMTTYNEYLEKTKRFKEKKDKIEAILGEDRNPSYHGVGDLSAMFASLYSKYRSGKENMSFNERWRLYCVINGLLHHDMESVYTLYGTDLRQIWGELRCFTDIENYLTVIDSVKLNEEKCRGCLCDEISFDTMYSNGSNIICSNVNHFFVRLDDELKCPFCGASTKEYNLTKEQLDFLTECAMAQNKLIKIITKDDMPLVQVLVHEEIDSMEAYDKELSQNQGSFEDQMFHHHDFDESVSTLGRNITKYIERAHKIDSGDYTDKWGNQSYFQKQFDDEAAKKLLDKVNQDLESARTMSLEPDRKSVV